MIVSINQPGYLPWLGAIERIAISDIHIVLDHVQFEKGSFINRNKVRTPDGWSWLTVPVLKKGKFPNIPINTLEIDNKTDWRKKHWLTIKSSHSKSPYFAEHESFFESHYKTDWKVLLEQLNHQRNYVLEALGITTKILFSSDIVSDKSKDELVLDLCQKVGCTTYISGPFGRDYLKEDEFSKNGIKVFYHDYNHPEYSQRWKGFEPNMSIFDLLFNCGEESLKVLRTTNMKSLPVNV